MQWKLSAEQDIYQATIRDWLAAVAPANMLRRWLDAGDASVFEARFGAEGWAGVGVPEELGGQGGGLVELALTAEELARAAAPSAAWLATALATPALARHPDLIEAALAGETITVLTPAEAIPGSARPLAVDPAGAVTGAVPRVLAADTARRFVVPVGQGLKSELRLVEADAAGVGITRRALLDRSRSVGDVAIDGALSQRLDVDAEPAGEHRPAEGHRLPGRCPGHDQAARLPGEGVVAVTYHVRAKRWAHGWELHVDGVGVTQSASLA
ncbi:MAG: acyl-CoA dehydrogenase family protein, partial [Sciscionella sp.]